METGDGCSLCESDPDALSAHPRWQDRLQDNLYRVTDRVTFRGALAPVLSGCAKWVSPNKALIMLSMRGKTDDKFWFTFFHEAGHLLKHGKKLTFLDNQNHEGLDVDEEQEADAFAADMLIDPSAYHAFCAARRFSASDVSAFTAQQGISPGIVVGRLQFDRLIPWSRHASLKTTYVI